VIVLLIFGPKRLPELGQSLGRGIREFKGSITGEHDDKPISGEIDTPAEAPTVTATPVAKDEPKQESSTGS
jgi:sec-independent protein translocase protein TatA